MPRDVAAAERKRLRDRVAQQNLRNRRQQYIQELEEKVKRCQERHGDGEEAEGNPEREQLWSKIQRLQDDNAALRARHKKLLAMLSSMRRLLDDVADEDDRDRDRDRHRHTDGGDRRPHGDGDDGLEDTLSSHDGLEGSSPHMSVDGSQPVVDAGTPPTRTLQQRQQQQQQQQQQQNQQQPSSISATPQVLRPAAGPAVTGTDYPSWPQQSMNNTSNLDAAAMASFQAHAPLPNTPPETAYSPQDPLLDSRLWNFMDLWTNYNDIDQLPMLTAASTAVAPGVGMDMGIGVGMGTDTGSGTGIEAAAAAGGPPPPPQASEDLPAWAAIPKRVILTTDRHYHPWERNMRAILDSADEPSPLDLVYGSSRNFLANEVQVTLKHFFAGPAERLCIGIIIYNFIKWRTKPSPERYNRLPDFMKPTLEQTRTPHPGCLDLMFWPRLRANVVEAYAKYDVDKVMRKYCACLCLRWSRDRDLLLPVKTTAAEGEGVPRETHELNPEFYARYTDLANWGLTPEFQQLYPELLEGVDPEATRITWTT